MPTRIGVLLAQIIGNALKAWAFLAPLALLAVVIWTALFIYIGGLYNFGAAATSQFPVPPRYLSQISFSFGGLMFVGLMFSKSVPRDVRRNLSIVLISSLLAAVGFLMATLGLPMVQDSSLAMNLEQWQRNLIGYTAVLGYLGGISFLAAAIGILLVTTPALHRHVTIDEKDSQPPVP